MARTAEPAKKKISERKARSAAAKAAHVNATRVAPECKISSDVIKLTPALAKMTAFKRLEHVGIDVICACIAGGESQGSIADTLKINRGHFAIWIGDNPTWAARVREARAISARHWDEAAVEALSTLNDNSGNGSIVKARELASHYRWRSKNYNPRDYGDATTLRGDPENPLRTVQELDVSKLNELSHDELTSLEHTLVKLKAQST